MERQPLSTSVNHRDTVAALEGALSDVGASIAHACERAGRDARDVRLIGVVKQVDVGTIRAARAAGLREFGENYVKDLEAKRSAAPDATWHFVGRLQANKVSRAVRSADLIHTLEPGRAARKLKERASSGDRVPPCLIQVDFTGERVGVSPDALAGFVEEAASAGIPLRGLMTVAPQDRDPRPWFSQLRRMRDELRERHREMTELSMGMSADLKVAVEEGATMVRVGTAIFGPRRR